MKLDILCLAAHPDDVELFAGGTVCGLVKKGYRVGIADFTRGERGTRGTPETRAREAALASKVMGLATRVNLGIPDGAIDNTIDNQQKIVRVIRAFRPHIILAHAEGDRHPDHGNAARLTHSAIFSSGLIKITTHDDDGSPQDPWRPAHVLQYVQNSPVLPDIIVDVSDVWEQRIETLLAFSSQFSEPGNVVSSEEPMTYISNPEFFKSIEARARALGQQIGVTYGEGFLYPQGAIPVTDPMNTFRMHRPY